MPGAFAHIAAISHLLAGNRLKGIKVSKEIKLAVTTQNEFCFMGAVSPDYPYLVPADKAAHAWADAIHIGGEMGQLIATGVREIRKLKDDDRACATAWLMGFAAHVAMDMTIHPIVENIAGIYSESKENQKKHRICEMHQDVHIWQTLKLGTVGEAEAIQCIKLCGDEKTGKVHPAVTHVWSTMLGEAYPKLLKKGAPDIKKWHKCFYKVVSIGEESHKFFSWARHVSVDAGYSYPTPEEVEEKYIKKLKVPKGAAMHYDDIFELGLQNVTRLWEAISVALESGDEKPLAFVGAWNLDRGMDQSERHVFWT